MLQVIIWNPSPIIVEIGSYSLRWYSLLFATGFIIGYYIIRKQFKEEGISLDLLDTYLFYSVIGTILGARIGNCLFYEFDYFYNRPLEMLLPFRFSPSFEFTGYQGLASHGAFIGLITAYWLLSRKTHRSILFYLDRTSIVAALGLGCIRLGNLMNSEILGQPFEGPWAFIFSTLPAPEGIIPRHPIQLYGFLLYVGLFLFMLRSYKMTLGKVRQGYLFTQFITLLGVIRFTIEFFKEHYVFDESNWLNMAQILSIPMIIFGGFFWLKLKENNQ